MAPMSTERAQAIAAALGEGGTAGAWRLDRSAVAERLHELVAEPGRIQQGSLNLCGPATLLRVWLARDPGAVARYATELFDEGRRRIGSVPVRPSRPLTAIAYGRTRR